MKRPIGVLVLLYGLVLLVWLNMPPLGEEKPKGQPVLGLPAELFGNETRVTVSGEVYRVEEHFSYSRQLWIYLNSVSISAQGSERNASDASYHLICVADPSLRPLIGSKITVTGQIQFFSHATNQGQFDAADYYASTGIDARLQKTRILWMSSEHSRIGELLYALSGKFRTRLYEKLPVKEASVLCAMLLGDKTGLDEMTEELYMQSGIVHILSISGLHISVLGMGIYRLLRRCRWPILIAAGMGSVVLILYGLLTGMSVSAIRAIGMYLIRMAGLVLGRTYDMLTSLALVFVLMVSDWTFYLRNSGFLLSFGAVLGMGILPGCFGEYEGKIPVLESLRKAVLPGFCILIFTLPIQLRCFYRIPTYSVILNLLILPFVELVMFVGTVVMIFPGNGFLAGSAEAVLRWYEWLSKVSLRLPGHSWNPGAPAIWQMICYYILLMAATVCWKKATLPGEKTKNGRRKQGTNK